MPEMRLAALELAIRHVNHGAAAEDIVNVAQVFHSFLRGDIAPDNAPGSTTDTNAPVTGSVNAEQQPMQPEQPQNPDAITPPVQQPTVTPQNAPTPDTVPANVVPVEAPPTVQPAVDPNAPQTPEQQPAPATDPNAQPQQPAPNQPAA